MSDHKDDKQHEEQKPIEITEDELVEQMENLETEEAMINPDDIVEIYEINDDVQEEREGEGIEEDERMEDGDEGRMEVEEGEIMDIPDESIHIINHKDSVYAVAVHPSKNNIIATGSGDDTACIWKLTDQQKQAELLFELQGHKDTVVDVAFNFDGKYLASGCMDGLVRIWDVESGKLVKELEGPSNEVEFIQWHPKGNVILAGSADTLCWMWNAEKGNCLNCFAGHSKTVCCGTFTSDGKLVLTGSEDGSVKIWNPKSAEVIHTFAGEIFSEAAINNIVSCPNNPIIFLSGSQDGKAQLCHIKNKKVIGVLQGHTDSTEGLDFSTQMELFGTSGMDGLINLYDLSTLKKRCTMEHEAGVIKIEFDKQKPLLYSCSVDGTIGVWDIRTGNRVKTCQGHTDMILDFALANDSSFIVSGSDDKTARVFKLN